MWDAAFRGQSAPWDYRFFYYYTDPRQILDIVIKSNERANVCVFGAA